MQAAAVQPSAQSAAAQSAAAQTADVQPAADSVVQEFSSTLSHEQVRDMIREAQTIVVKVGSSSLTAPQGHLDRAKLHALVDALARTAQLSARIVLVSSGAIAAGFGPLGLTERPTDVATQQAAASVGQGVLMSEYEAAFAHYGLRVGQILITARDTITPAQYRNARRTLNRLLDLGVIPIVNENDALASNEIRFGDNDRLSALVANIVQADALILLTDVDGLYTAPPSDPTAKPIHFVSNVHSVLQSITVGGSGSSVGTGGMHTKLDAARVANESGIPVVLTCARQAGPALMGDPVGTVFAPTHERGTARRLWIGFASHPRGKLIADAGAVQAVRSGKASLLSAGVVGVEGDFSAGDPVAVVSESGELIAKGIAAYDAEEVPQTLGRTTAQIKRLLGEEYAHPLVHRDDLVLVHAAAANM